MQLTGTSSEVAAYEVRAAYSSHSLQSLCSEDSPFEEVQPSSLAVLGIGGLRNITLIWNESRRHRLLLFGF